LNAALSLLEFCPIPHHVLPHLRNCLAQVSTAHVGLVTALLPVELAAAMLLVAVLYPQPAVVSSLLLTAPI